MSATYNNSRYCSVYRDDAVDYQHCFFKTQPYQPNSCDADSDLHWHNTMALTLDCAAVEEAPETSSKQTSDTVEDLKRQELERAQRYQLEKTIKLREQLQQAEYHHHHPQLVSQPPPSLNSPINSTQFSSLNHAPQYSSVESLQSLDTRIPLSEFPKVRSSDQPIFRRRIGPKRRDHRYPDKRSYKLSQRRPQIMSGKEHNRRIPQTHSSYGQYQFPTLPFYNGSLSAPFPLSSHESQQAYSKTQLSLMNSGSGNCPQIYPPQFTSNLYPHLRYQQYPEICKFPQPVHTSCSPYESPGSKRTDSDDILKQTMLTPDSICASPKENCDRNSATLIRDHRSDPVDDADAQVHIPGNILACKTDEERNAMSCKTNTIWTGAEGDSQQSSSARTTNRDIDELCRKHDCTTEVYTTIQEIISRQLENLYTSVVEECKAIEGFWEAGKSDKQNTIGKELVLDYMMTLINEKK